MMELANLQMQAPGMHASLARVQFKSALGKYPEDMFREFDPEPFAAASLGQVHRAVTFSGEKVAVKIQYPAIRSAIESDLKLLRSATLPGRVTGHVPGGMVDEIARGLLEETDYLREAGNLDYFRKGLAGLDFVTVPRVHRELTSDRVLTMSFVEGESLSAWLKRKPSQALRDLAGARLCEAYETQLQHLRVIQTDQNQEALEMLCRQKHLNFTPGDEHSYSNSGYLLLALVVERIAGQPLRQFLGENIFVPLGMSTARVHDDHAEVIPNRAIGYAKQGKGKFRIEMMMEVSGPPAFPIVPESANQFATTDGRARMRFERGANGKIVKLTVLQGKDVFAHWKVDTDREAAADCQGTFFSDEIDARYSIVVRDRRLVVKRGRAEAELLPLEDEPDSFVGSEWWAEQIRFHQDDTGSIKGFALTTGRLKNLEFRKE